MSDLSPMFGKKETIPGFNLIEHDDTANPISYLGYQDLRGNWLIEKLDQTTTDKVSYATIGSNPTCENYTDAWINRVTLTYGNYENIF